MRALMTADSGDGEACALVRRLCNEWYAPRSSFQCREFDRGPELKLCQWPRHLEGDKSFPMSEFLIYALVPIAIGAVAVVLVLGLHNMARGGSPQRSQKLMRLRVLLQFIAIIVIMLTIWAIGK
jgi:Hypoxia induced protein conserved region